MNAVNTINVMPQFFFQSGTAYDVTHPELWWTFIYIELLFLGVNLKVFVFLPVFSSL